MGILGHFRLNPYWNQESGSNLGDHFLDHILERESYFLDVKMKIGALNELLKSNTEAIFDWRPRNGLTGLKLDKRALFATKMPLYGEMWWIWVQKNFFPKNHLFFIFYAFNPKSPLSYSLKWSKLLPNYIYWVHIHYFRLK